MAEKLLVDPTLKNVKPGDKDKRLNDGGGLYLLVKPSGAKWWRFDYSIDGKRKTLSLGVYPKTTLNDARRKATETKNNLLTALTQATPAKKKRPMINW